MIREIAIRNFRCFESLLVRDCRRINLLVGDNGSGKTALLEAIFLALSNNVEASVRLKAQRGFDTRYSGSAEAIEEGIWRDYFFDQDWRRAITIGLSGDGEDSRQLTIARGSGDIVVPFEGFNKKEASAPAPIVFSWRDAAGLVHQASPRITARGIEFASTAEMVPSEYFLFSASQTVSATEAAARFSALSRQGRERGFVDIFTREYPWICDLDIEVVGGVPTIHATLADTKTKMPINAVSGGINRVMAIMLALASQSNTVVLVDEVENGIYFEHKAAVWRGLLSLARRGESQMFLTTHDEEWLDALVEAADETADIALWRLERGPKGDPVLRQFTGGALKAGLEFQGELR
jgi:energy-coupling factor transporter ATP-binding protein EcfA2